MAEIDSPSTECMELTQIAAGFIMGDGSLGWELDKHQKHRFSGRDEDKGLRLCNLNRLDHYK